MTPVYQTIFNDINGNCWQATWATLLGLPLDKVPNFVEHDDYHAALCDFIRPFGYEYDRYLVNGRRQDFTPEELSRYEFFGDTLPDYGHIGGYYDAVVWSPGLYTEEKPVAHAVIVDRHFNVIHDPNPNYLTRSYPLSESIGKNGVIGVALYAKI